MNKDYFSDIGNSLFLWGILTIWKAFKWANLLI